VTLTTAFKYTVALCAAITLQRRPPSKMEAVVRSEMVYFCKFRSKKNNSSEVEKKTIEHYGKKGLEIRGKGITLKTSLGLELVVPTEFFSKLLGQKMVMTLSSRESLP
jgi:hypothetical protein